jgi:alpha-2-macroglobulin-like protein
MRKLALALSLALSPVLLAAACTPKDDGSKKDVAPGEPVAPGKRGIVPPVEPEKAPPASRRASGLPSVARLTQGVESYFAGQVGARVYVQVDKPLYKPGETIWFRAWHLGARALEGLNQGDLTAQLVSPKGAVVLEKRLAVQNGYARNDFEIPDDVQGGEYLVRIQTPQGEREERPVIVSSYEAPRLKKKLEFVRKAYGPGDIVAATLELKRPTGEPLADKEITVIARLDGAELPRVQTRTNAEGGALAKVPLPAEIAVGDGLLTVLVEDGGITESVSKSIPIVLKRMQLSLFPEGGKLVAGVESRVYFEAKTPLGKPADVAGRIVDDQGSVLASFESWKEGLGRFTFTPSTGRTYKAEITKPEGVLEKYPLPLAEADGCVLRAYDDLDGALEELRVGVTCASAKKVIVTALAREELIDAAALEVKEGVTAVAYLKPSSSSTASAATRRQGIARVTLFDAELSPLAERLVYRHRRETLQVKVTPHKESYAPRDQVSLAIQTTDSRGAPVPAELALSVVDDTVVSFADDKTGHMLSRLYLEPEIPGKVEEPRFFFDLTEEKSALALDLLMGTRGWRRFEWAPLLDAPRPDASTVAWGGRRGVPAGMALEAPAMPPPAPEMVDFAEAPAEGRGLEEPEAVALPAVRAKGAMPKDAKLAEARPAARPRPHVRPAVFEADAARAPPPPPMQQVAARRVRAEGVAAGELLLEDRFDDALGAAAGKGDRDWAGAQKPGQREAQVLAAVRVFPAPSYGGVAVPEVRTDFRETIHWEPQVKTGRDGMVTVTFWLSDAVTSFRVFTEGTGAGKAGRDETVIKSSLPFSLAAKLPVEVSAGDRIRLPVTLSNEGSAPVDVMLDASFGSLVTPEVELKRAGRTLAAGGRDSAFYPLVVGAQAGTTPIALRAEAQGLKDEMTRELTVVPRGFPVEVAASGTLKNKVVEVVDTGDAIPGSASGFVRFYPSPTSTLISGLDGMLRQPSGCFEQTSSTNYPNVMILSYMERNDVADAALVERASGLLHSGYRKLVSFESPDKGYEWFGGNPGHEALTAYGLLQFIDMRGVYKDVDGGMIDRTAAWLRSRRDGKGGFLRNDRALDSFGRASPEVTNAYIMYALSEAGLTNDLPAEMQKQSQLGASTQDQYLLALAANTLLNSEPLRAQGQAAARRLAAMQDASGGWLKADHSITRSGGVNLHIETTALAVTALLKAGGADGQVRKAVDWLTNNRGGYGQWGATQATILALKAFIRYVEASKQTQGPGSVVVQVGGKNVGTARWEAGHKDPIVVELPSEAFGPGKNEVRMLIDGKDELPYSMAVTFRSKKPATSEQVKVDLAVSADKSTVKMGETIRVTAAVKNKTSEGLPMTLARIGIPGGTAFQTWQLKELKDKELIAFWETRAREVILYFRDLKPGEEKVIPLDLVANVPGDYEAPASSAYLYYTDEHKVWVDPIRTAIEP